ncbi:MAG: FimB/Mfa2 family fimbrial subunit [Muribaculaceae bacterium]|nr:FimB/Mfa2 family fimbrial subunit [Muribaculaceae bacterium]
MHIEKFQKSLVFSSALFAAVLTPGCGLVTEDLDPCPEELRLKFKDAFLKETDAFQYEVNSINVWAFDPQGAPVWSGRVSGPELKDENFFLQTTLGEGTYDFVAWGGLEDNESFELATYTPASKEDLEVKMQTLDEDGKYVSRTRLQGVYNGVLNNVEYKADPLNPNIKEVTVQMYKDTKDIRVMLQHLDGKAIDEKDFSVTITDANSVYAWDNTLLPSPVVTYEPWNTKYGVVTTPDPENAETRDITTIASLLFELSTGRLMEDSNAILTVHRNWDDRDIIRIPLVDYLLLIRGYYGNIPDQEYLDLQDDYSMVFFIDSSSNWYLAAGIYINGWAVVPPQVKDF